MTDFIDRLMKGDMTAYDELFPTSKPEDRARAERFIKRPPQDVCKRLWIAIAAHQFAPRFFDGDDGCRCDDPIISAVAAEYGVSADEIFSRNRLKRVSEARQMAMYLYAEKPHPNLSEIARVFGRHHATVIYAVQKNRFLISNDKEVSMRYKRIKSNIDAK